MLPLFKSAPIRELPRPPESPRMKRVDRSGKSAAPWLFGLLATVLTTALFLASGPLIRLWDATAGVMDIGIVSVLPLAMLVVAVARLSAAGIYQSMVGLANELTVWQRTLCYGCLHLSYFWAVVLVVTRLV